MAEKDFERKENLEKFLLEGNVFTPALIKSYTELKRKEVEAVNTRPHPFEFHLYSDI